MLVSMASANAMWFPSGSAIITTLPFGPDDCFGGGIAGIGRDTSGGLLAGVTGEAASPALIEFR
jgi:hypothetical protein